MHCCFHLSSTSPLYAAERIWRATLDLAVIVILLAGVWWLRSPLHALPLERDEGAYALIATRWLKGAVLYRDLFDHKPPFIYLVYALAPRCAAAPVVAVRALATVYLMLVGATTTLLAWRLYGRVAALGGLLLTLVYSSSLAFEGLTFNSEAVMALPAVIACQLVVMGMLTCKRWLLCCGGIAVGVDAAGNASGYSNSVIFTLPRDTTPPTKPAVSLTDVGPTHVSLAWSSTEDGSNVWFTVFMNGTSISQGSKNTSGTFGPLEPETTYTFTVQAQDFGGNLSPLSDPITVTTEPSDHNDVTPPTTPGNLRTNGMQFGDGETWLFWDQSTDNQTAQSLIEYKVYANGVYDHSVVGRGSTVLYGNPSAVNTYTVIAVDAAGNESPPATITVDNF